LGPELLTVTFYDGETIIEVLPAEMNYPLGEVSKSEKSSKPNAILLGYFTDRALTNPFYSDDPVTGNYGKPLFAWGVAKFLNPLQQRCQNFTLFHPCFRMHVI